MKVLVTGGFGNVGRSTVDSLLAKGHSVRVFDRNTKAGERTARKLRSPIVPGSPDVLLGDILNIRDMMHAVAGMDAVIHLAAVIPPKADRFPEEARLVNVEGTRNLLACLLRRAAADGTPPARLIFASSVAVYGDRLYEPFIRTTDTLRPNPRDHYAAHKIECEALIRETYPDWTILRLSYIADPARLKLDPLMFEMPLETSLEICDTRDAGEAFAEAVTQRTANGKILHVAGGRDCRTTYREYLETMFQLMGLGKTPIEEQAFSKNDFHCGHMDTEESQKLLHFQHRSLGDFYADVKRIYASKRFFIRLLHRAANKVLYLKSPHFRRTLREKMGIRVTRSSVYLRYLLGNKYRPN